MTMTDPQPADPKPSIRWYRLTPDRLVLVLLAVECLLWLSERFGWLLWHKGYAVLTAVALVAAALVAMLLWFAVALVFHLRFQFSIRSLLVAAVAVAIPCSWLGVKMQQERRQSGAATAIEELGGIVSWSEPSGPEWLRKTMGDDYFQDVEAVILNLANSKTSDTGLEHLKEFTELYLLQISDTKDTDKGMETGGTRLTDRELEHLKGLPQLHELEIFSTGVTDAGLENLKGLSQLELLSLNYTQVSDTGLENLSGLSQLRELYLYGTKVTAEGVKKLQRALPKCKIYN